jgi:hypothetical protein
LIGQAAGSGAVFGQLRSGYIFESRIGQEWTRSRIDPLLLPVADNASVVQAVSLYDHQSRGRSVFDRKDYFDVPWALHG